MKTKIFLLNTLILLAACAATPETRVAESEKLDRVVEAYFEASLEMNPLFATFIGDHRFNDRLPNTLGPEYRERERALERTYLEKIRAIDVTRLEGQDRITYETFRLDRERAIEGERFPAHLIPINQFFSMPNFFALLGSGQSVQPFGTVKDYENWLDRVDGFVVLMRQAEANLREGVRQGITQPKIIVEKVLPQLAAHVVSDPEQSLFWNPVKNMPEDFSPEDRERLTAAYRKAIETRIVPAYRGLHDYLRAEYLPAARDTFGLYALPDGRAWYEYRIRMSTTTALPAAAIHAMGLAEVKRIRGEMEKVMRSVGFDGTLAEWFEYVKSADRFYYDNEEALLDGYRAIETRMNKAVPKLFDVDPEAGFEVRAVEAFRAASAAGASYQSPSPDGSRPGIFYVNTHNLRAQPKFGMETLFIHEAIPGHHFQIALQIALDDLPRFRRFGGYTAFSEGWALYAESLGKELGFFQDPMQWYGRLSDEMLRAMRLVVDTGLHSEGWTRERAIAFMQQNSSMAYSDIVAEVERYMAIPGQALAYKIGQFRISELRERAARELGGDFDIREFHTQVLMDGALPLDVLEAKIDRWIAAERG
ncbi:MAG TPA: DUF885 domain-containing protein [Gammaproteobacteria bacterium]